MNVNAVVQLLMVNAANARNVLGIFVLIVWAKRIWTYAGSVKMTSRILRQQNGEEYARRLGPMSDEDEGRCPECGFDLALGDCQRCIDVARAKDKKKVSKTRYKLGEIW